MSLMDDVTNEVDEGKEKGVQAVKNEEGSLEQQVEERGGQLEQEAKTAGENSIKNEAGDLEKKVKMSLEVWSRTQAQN